MNGGSWARGVGIVWGILVWSSIGAGQTTVPSTQPWKSETAQALDRARGDWAKTQELQNEYDKMGYRSVPVDKRAKWFDQIPPDERARLVPLMTGHFELHGDLIELWQRSGDPGPIPKIDPTALDDHAAEILEYYRNWIEKGPGDKDAAVRAAVPANIAATQGRYCFLAVNVLQREIWIEGAGMGILIDPSWANPEMTTGTQQQYHMVFSEWYDKHKKDMVWDKKIQEFCDADGEAFHLKKVYYEFVKDKEMNYQITPRDIAEDQLVVETSKLYGALTSKKKQWVMTAAFCISKRHGPKLIDPDFSNTQWKGMALRDIVWLRQQDHETLVELDEYFSFFNDLMPQDEPVDLDKN